jgi:Mg2+ and Co2+ transporter CorA
MKRRPIAAELRRQAGKKAKMEKLAPVLVSIEDQIAALERELDNSEDSEDNSDSEDCEICESETEAVRSVKKVIIESKADLVEVRDLSGNIVSLKSSLEGKKRLPLHLKYISPMA